MRVVLLMAIGLRAVGLKSVSWRCLPLLQQLSLAKPLPCHQCCSLCCSASEAKGKGGCIQIPLGLGAASIRDTSGKRGMVARGGSNNSRGKKAARAAFVRREVHLKLAAAKQGRSFYSSTPDSTDAAGTRSGLDGIESRGSDQDHTQEVIDLRPPSREVSASGADRGVEYATGGKEGALMELGGERRASVGLEGERETTVGAVVGKEAVLKLGLYEESSWQQAEEEAETVAASYLWIGGLPDMVRGVMAEMILVSREMGGAAEGQEEQEGAESDDEEQSAADLEMERRFRLRFAASSSDGEQRLQMFAARQMAIRLIKCHGSRCQTCWLEPEDCICSQLFPAAAAVPLPHSSHSHHPSVPSTSMAAPCSSTSLPVVFWLYMHPKELLRRNNTGKLLWQVLGATNARLVICGVKEHEEQMWHELKQAGSDHVYCLYPLRSSPLLSVASMQLPSSWDSLLHSEACMSTAPLHVILLDGTWNNSKSMFKRLQSRASAALGLSALPCISLDPQQPSVMHGLRIQPSKERTCTAAAAFNLLHDLHLRLKDEEKEASMSQTSMSDAAGLEKRSKALESLEKNAKAIDDAIVCLLDALAARRRRSGKSGLRLGVGKNKGFLQQRR